MKANILFIFIVVQILLFPCWNNIIIAQTFNVKKQAQVQGMPGFVYNDVWGYKRNGQEFAIVGSSQAINIYNVTDCANPTLVLAHVDGSSVTWRDFKTYQNYAYGVCDGGACTEGLEIINLDNYTVTQNTSSFLQAHNIFIDTLHGRLYVVGLSPGMKIFTLDTEIINGVPYNGTPANPVLIANYTTQYIHDIYVKNNIAYASQGYDGYKIFDVSNVNNIQVLASLDATAGYNHSSWVTSDGHYAYIAEEIPRGNPIRIFEISGTGVNTSINYVGEFKDPLEKINSLDNRPHNPFVKGDTLFISYYEDGVQAFDISDRLDPKRIAYYDTYLVGNGTGYPDINAFDGCWGTYPYLPSGCILGSDITGGLFTFKLDFPNNDTPNLGKITSAKSTDVLVSTPGRGIVLRSEQGYCFRIRVDNFGNIYTEEVTCHVYNETPVRIEHNDLAFDLTTKGPILKDPANSCKRLRVDLGGTLFIENASCITTNQTAIVSNGDIIIESYTKGLVLKDYKNTCYRVTVDNNGNLMVATLNSCP